MTTTPVPDSATGGPVADLVGGAVNIREDSREEDSRKEDSREENLGEENLREEDYLRLDQQICFSLHAASRAFGGLYRVILKDLGLTYPQYLVMLVLWEHGELPVKKVGERLRLDSGTLSPLLKRLETAGLVRRERSARDERSVLVGLTDEGVALRDQALRVPRRISAATGFDVAEILDLRSRLDKLTDALDAATLEETPGPE